MDHIIICKRQWSNGQDSTLPRQRSGFNSRLTHFCFFILSYYIHNISISVFHPFFRCYSQSSVYNKHTTIIQVKLIESQTYRILHATVYRSRHSHLSYPSCLPNEQNLKDLFHFVSNLLITFKRRSSPSRSNSSNSSSSSALSKLNTSFVGFD